MAYAMKTCLFMLTTLVLLGAMDARAADTYFQVATTDVNAAVSKALVDRGVASKVQAITYTSKDSLYQANQPLSVAIQALSYDADAQHWQANMNVISNGQTVSVMPIQGRYTTVTSVPVLNRKLAHDDTIAQSDITYKDVTEREVRKDTILKPEEMIGKSPHTSISPGRPVRSSELDLPTLVKKGQQVAVTYTSEHMSINTVGEALEDGSKGDLIRIQNLQSKHAFSARVTGDERVEANMQTTATN